jgi:5,6,7,8-tetrahydromethanopterin hydro-lyase
MFGPAQAAVARAVADSVEAGVLPGDDNLCVLVGVFIHWEADDDQKIFDFNYRATKESIARAMRGEPKAETVTSRKSSVAHPFASGSEKQLEKAEFRK